MHVVMNQMRGSSGISRKPPAAFATGRVNPGRPARDLSSSAAPLNALLLRMRARPPARYCADDSGHVKRDGWESNHEGRVGLGDFLWLIANASAGTTLRHPRDRG